MSASLSHFETAEIIEGYRTFVDRFSEYADLAQVGSNDAESWRGFDVGSVGVGILPGQTEPIVIAGANYKHNHAAAETGPEIEAMHGDEELEHITDMHARYEVPTASPKNCAEMDTCLQASELYGDKNLHFVGFVIAATTDQQEIREVTKLSTQTLTPCNDCVDVLTGHESTSRATLYASTGFSSRDIFEIRTIRGLKDVYKSGGDNVGSHTPRLSVDLGVRAVELFDARIKHTEFVSRRPSRAISVVARAALVEAGRQSWRS